MVKKFDLIVIGAGPAGEKGASKAAQYGRRVALIERRPYLGGAGINTGTVPSKTLRESALYFSGLRQRGLYGIDYSLRENLTIKDFTYRERAVRRKERKMIAAHMQDHHVEVIHGIGSLQDRHTVQIRTPAGEREITGDVILIATGSSPHHPPEFPFDHELICDSDSILKLKRIPKTLAVIGGGVIGTEYASIFTALGVRVTLIDRGHRILSFMDTEIGQRLMDQLLKLGIKFVFEERVTGMARRGDQVHLTLENGGRLKVDVALIAAGRQSNVKALNLEQVGVQVGQRGLILVNENYQTNIPNIYAVGDVIGFPALASTSMEQARAAVVHAFDLKYKETLAPFLPFAVYAIPEVAMVGLTEHECQEKKIPYLVGRGYFEENARGQIIGESGMIKLIFSPASKKLLGAHILGEGASELIHIAAHVMLAGGPIDEFIRAVYNYPTLSDTYQYAAYDGLAQHARWLEAKKRKRQK